MDIENLFIQNRNGLKVAVRVESPKTPMGLVVIAHGMSGFMDQVHIQAFAEAYLENGYRVVRFDATHSLGQSDGGLFDVTYDSYIADLEDVIEWASEQEWFTEPFALCGHSMGAQSTAWYAEHHPERVGSLATMAPTINFELYGPTIEPSWKQQGYQTRQSVSSGKEAKISYAVVESLELYDLLSDAGKLTMPVLDIVGEKDKPCPPENQKIFIHAINSPAAKIAVIPNTQHSYRNAETDQYGEEIEQVKTMLSEWLRSLNT